MSGTMIQRKKQPTGYSLRRTSGVARWQVAAYLRSRSVSLLAVAVSMAFPIGAARAGGPIQVANVASGTAAFAQAGSVTTITAANNTIINYQKFGIPQGNTVDFIQPSASARVLNRIIGPTPTQIDGTLNANGVVYFVNPAGVMFGAGAVINVGQLYAAAGHMSDADFLSGVNSFTDNGGSITNAGVIKAGDVTFAAGNISNNGTILTPEGMVVMAAGKDIYVSKLGSPFLVQVAGTSTVKTGGTQVSNSGTLDAAGGDVAIRAGDMYSLAINTSGTIKAANVSIQAAGAGSTVLVSGKIDAANQATGSAGGTIAVNGGNIGIGVTADAAGNYHNASAALSAQGAHGGGKILIGVKPDAASATGYSDASGYDFIGS
ncbi:MAG: filamentous hemagglutinin N-terminal domain-containing protein, partial [Phycisphaerae bacterium]